MVGIIFQSDAQRAYARWFIRPIETLDRRLAGLHDPAEPAPLAMHAGIPVKMDNWREFVAEQLGGIDQPRRDVPSLYAERQDRLRSRRSDG